MFKGIATSWAGAVLTILLTYFLTPYTLGQMGQERYGAWLLITSFTGYLALLALGTPMSSVRHLTTAAQTKDPRQLNAAIGLLLGVNALLAVMEMTVGLVLFTLFDRLYPMSPKLESEVLPAFLLLVFQVGLSFISIVPSAVLQAEGHFVPAHSIAIVVLVCRGVVTVVSLYWLRSLGAMALTQLACTLCEAGLGWLLVRRLVPAARFRLRRLVWADIRPVAAFSVYVLVLSLGVQLSFQTDALIVGRVLGVEAVPYYGVPNSLMVSVMGLIISIAAVVMPTATRLHQQGATGELRVILLKWTKIAFTLVLTVAVYLVVLGPSFLGRWMGPDYKANSGVVLITLALASIIFLPIRGVGLPLLMGLGQPRQVTLAFLGCAVVNIISSLVLIHPLGLFGEALGTAIPNAAFALIAMVLSCRAVQLPVAELLAYVVPGPLLGSLPALAALLALRATWEIDTYGELVAAGVFMCLVQAAGLFLVFQRDPHIPVPALSRFRLSG